MGGQTWPLIWRASSTAGFSTFIPVFGGLLCAGGLLIFLSRWVLRGHRGTKRVLALAFTITMCNFLLTVCLSSSFNLAVIFVYANGSALGIVDGD